MDNNQVIDVHNIKQMKQVDFALAICGPWLPISYWYYWTDWNGKSNTLEGSLWIEELQHLLKKILCKTGLILG